MKLPITQIHVIKRQFLNILKWTRQLLVSDGMNFVLIIPCFSSGWSWENWSLPGAGDKDEAG